MLRTDAFEKTLMLGKIEGRRRRGWQRMRWLDGITDSMDMSEWTPGVGDGQGGLACSNVWLHKESDMTERLNWTETECSARDNPPISVHNSISFSPVSWCHFMLFLEFTTNNILHYIPDLVKDVIILVILSRSLFTGFRACVLCVSAADPWVFSGFILFIGFILTSLWKVDYLTGLRS